MTRIYGYDVCVIAKKPSLSSIQWRQTLFSQQVLYNCSQAPAGVADGLCESHNLTSSKSL